jgi:hypothetical protein
MAPVPHLDELVPIGDAGVAFHVTWRIDEAMAQPFTVKVAVKEPKGTEGVNT